MATDGAFTKTSPNYPGGAVPTEFDETRENFEWLERELLMLGHFTGLTGYFSSYTYDGSGNLTTVTVKNSGGITQGTCTLTYSGGNLITEAWVINGKTLTYTLTYSGGNLSSVSLAIT